MNLGNKIKIKLLFDLYLRRLLLLASENLKLKKSCTITLWVKLSVSKI